MRAISGPEKATNVEPLSLAAAAAWLELDKCQKERPVTREDWWLVVEAHAQERDVAESFLATELEKTWPCPAEHAPTKPNRGFEAFLRGYLDCMLYSTNDESDESGGNPLDDNYTKLDIADEARSAARRQCWAFYRANADDLATVDDYLASECRDQTRYCSDERAGELFWYTRNGHGVGYCDHYKAEPEVAAAMDRLSEASERYGSVDPYVGDDGLIYGLGEYDCKAHVRITFSTITDESASNGDHAESGWMVPTDEHWSPVRATEADGCPVWTLRDALRFMRRNAHVETCWTPENNRLGMTLSGTGNTDDCEGDEIEVCYDLHVHGMSVGSMMRLARLLKANGVYFANRAPSL